MASGARGRTRDFVLTPTDAPCPAAFDLVPESVGEGLGGVAAVDPVPVRMQEGVKVGKAQSTSGPSQQGEAYRTEAPSLEPRDVGGEGRQRVLAADTWTAAASPQRYGPQFLAKFRQPGDQACTTVGKGGKFVVDVVELGEQSVAFLQCRLATIGTSGNSSSSDANDVVALAARRN